MKKIRNKKKGFTLVELLAVIVILAIILVIAVPKVMSIIEDAKKGTLESTAKMIASAAEKAKVQNTVLGKTEEITCDSVAKINKGDYANCSITFENNTAKVTIEGGGKFDGLYVCGGTKTDAEASNEECKGPTKTLVSHIQELLPQEETLNNGLLQTNVEYEGTTYNAGLRYVGEIDEVKNKVYYNCDDTDSNGNTYGTTNYDYASSCEVWRIIGVFDTKTSTGSTSLKRIKLINIASTFSASWDSSASDINKGTGINQWGEVKDSNDNVIYEGADLMRLLNGFYIGEDTTCVYCTGQEQESCAEICTAESLKNANMKLLTNTAKGMIENVVWDTYAVFNNWDNKASDIYLEEKGISEQFTGNNQCSLMESYAIENCNDTIERTTSWTGLVGLMSVSEREYGGKWISAGNTITPDAYYASGAEVWYAYSSGKISVKASDKGKVSPSVYLKSGIKIIGGNGDTEPYKLAM